MDGLVLQRQSLFVSAGHSGTDSGAVANGQTEAGIVTDFRNLVSDELYKLGVSHNTDGAGATNLPLREAVKLASAHDIAVEFHTNAATPAATGAETLSHPEDYGLCRSLCQIISNILDIPNRGAKPENAGQHSRLAFVSDGGGIIVELFFITNRGDLAAYHNNKHQLAQAVAGVLADHVRCDYGVE